MTTMSPLSLIKGAKKRRQALSKAQMTHLRQTAYRGVDTTAHQPPSEVYKTSSNLKYRGNSYNR